MDSTLRYRDVGSWMLTGAICGLIVAATTHLIGVSRPHGEFADEIRLLFDTSPVLGYVLYVVGGAVVGVAWGLLN